jgi:hypothetical protein
MLGQPRGWDRPQMDRQTALEEIERMHRTRTVRREAIIGWYRWFEGELPKALPPMFPERTECDLIMTAGLWMTLTDAGGEPGFPYGYHSELNLSPIPGAPNPDSVNDPVIRPMIERVQVWSASASSRDRRVPDA